MAFYGPNDTLATKVVVSVILTKNNQPDFLKRWLSEGDLDVRLDPTIGEQVLAFLKTYAPRSTVVTDSIIGCRTKKARITRKELLARTVPIGPDATASHTSAFTERKNHHSGTLQSPCEESPSH